MYRVLPPYIAFRPCGLLAALWFTCFVDLIIGSPCWISLASSGCLVPIAEQRRGLAGMLGLAAAFGPFAVFSFWLLFDAVGGVPATFWPLGLLVLTPALYANSCLVENAAVRHSQCLTLGALLLVLMANVCRARSKAATGLMSVVLALLLFLPLRAVMLTCQITMMFPPVVAGLYSAGQYLAVTQLIWGSSERIWQHWRGATPANVLPIWAAIVTGVLRTLRLGTLLAARDRGCQPEALLQTFAAEASFVLSQVSLQLHSTSSLMSLLWSPDQLSVSAESCLFVRTQLLHGFPAFLLTFTLLPLKLSGLYASVIDCWVLWAQLMMHLVAEALALTLPIAAQWLLQVLKGDLNDEKERPLDTYKRLQRPGGRLYVTLRPLGIRHMPVTAIREEEESWPLQRPTKNMAALGVASWCLCVGFTVLHHLLENQH